MYSWLVVADWIGSVTCVSSCRDTCTDKPEITRRYRHRKVSSCGVCHVYYLGEAIKKSPGAIPSLRSSWALPANRRDVWAVTRLTNQRSSRKFSTWNIQFLSLFFYLITKVRKWVFVHSFQIWFWAFSLSWSICIHQLVVHYFWSTL